MEERTLCILFGKEGARSRTAIESLISSRGFSIVDEAQVCGEVVEEAGIDAMGEDALADPDLLHIALVLERKSAVSLWKEMVGKGAGALNKNSLAALYPSISFYASPSISAASMGIATLFPHLGTVGFSPSSDTSSPPKDESPLATVANSRANPPSFPFALSNLAHQIPSQNKVISPTVERALRKLELAEKRRSGGSPDTDEIEAENERRVFSFHSRENTGEIGLEEGDLGYSEEEYPEEYDEDDLEILEDEQAQYAAVPPVHSRTSSSTSSFHARPLPASHAVPFAEPRLTKAAALRLGIALPVRPTRTREDSVTSEGSTSTTSAAPRFVPIPKSLAAPSIVPRGTKASALRSGGEHGVTPKPTTKAMRRQSLTTAERSSHPTFDNTPGHKRRGSFPVASTARPKLEPRLSRAALLRAGIEVPASPQLLRRQSSAISSNSSISNTEENSSKQSRRESITVKSTAPPLLTPRATKASTLRGGAAKIDTPSLTRGRSTAALEDLVEDDESAVPPSFLRSHTTAGTSVEGLQTLRAVRRESTVRMTKSATLRLGIPPEPQTARTERDPSTESNTFEGVAGHKRRESIKVASTAKPKVEPRMSKASMLRAGIEVEAPVRRVSAAPVDFEGVPGHRRRETIQVASSRPPAITPRGNKASLIRTGSGEIASPLYTRSVSVLTSAPLSLAPPVAVRSNSALSISNTASRTPLIAPRGNKAATLRQAQKEAEQNKQNKTPKGIAKPKTVVAQKSTQNVPIFTISALAELTPNGGVSPRNSVVIDANDSRAHSALSNRTG